MVELPKTMDERVWEVLRNLVEALPQVRTALDPNKLRAVREAKKILKEARQYGRC